MRFEYDEGWLANGYPLSLSLPLEQPPEQWQEDAMRRFFSNLLPEGHERALLVQELRISDRDFRLLEALGGECAGALSLLPPDDEPLPLESDYLPATPEDVWDMVDRQALPESLMGTCHPRYSLAGAQPKVAVMVRDGEMHLPVGNSPSTHIIKFEPRRFRGASALEACTMALATACGLECARAECFHVGVGPYLLVKRYDRVMDRDGAITRLHQEDFCQATGTGSRRKHEADGGPSLADCAAVLRQASSNAQADCEMLVQWQAFNVLCGNADGHAKNLALLRQANGDVRLAPCYDLLCTCAFPNVDTALAFSVNGKHQAEEIGKADWRALSLACGLDGDFAANACARMAEAMPDLFAAVRARFEAEHGRHPVLMDMDGVVRRNCATHLQPHNPLRSKSAGPMPPDA